MATYSSSCWENPMNRGAWWTIVHGVKKTQTCTPIQNIFFVFVKEIKITDQIGHWVSYFLNER